MASDTYDKSSKLNIGNEDLEQAKFFITLLNKIAVRVGAEYDAPVNTKSVDIINDYSISSVAVTKNTEVEIDLPEKTKMVFIKCRKIGLLQVATSSGGDYLSIGKGGHFSQARSNLPSAKKLYCTVTSSDNILEVLIAT